MYNCNAAILNNVSRILDENGVAFHICEKSNGGYPGSGKRGPCYALQINSMSGCAKLLNLIIPHLVGKIEQAKLLARFLDSRIKRISGVKRVSMAPYNPEELELLAKVTDLNGNIRGCSETIREAINHVKQPY